MGNVQTIEPTKSNVISIPSNYPTTPAPGKLEMLWDTNNYNLYREFSPYTNGGNPGFGLYQSQPFYYTFADQSNSDIVNETKYESQIFPLGSAEKDVVRVGKFLASGKGILFLAQQELLQSLNVFNETRLYNPTSPIVAAGMSIALGTVRPQRNFDTSAGIGGIVSTLIGSTIPDALFGSPKINPPQGTVSTALPDATLTTGGKGLIRADTANKGLSHLQSAYPPAAGGGGGGSLLNFFASTVKNLASTLFSSTLSLIGISAGEPGVIVKSDEGAYGMMIGAGNSKFSYNRGKGGVFGFNQQWIGGGVNTRKNDQYPANPYRLFIDPYGVSLPITNDDLSSITIQDPNGGIFQVGYTVQESRDANSPGFRYGDNVGIDNSNDFEASDIMVQYSEYVNPDNPYPTKETSLNIVNQINTTLQKVLDKLGKTSGGIYNVNVPSNARVISSGNSTSNGYDRLFSTNRIKVSPINYPLGVLQDYRMSGVVDNTLTLDSVNNSIKLPTAGIFDAINTLTVLSSDMKIPNSMLKGWNEWKPYTDDQIALYFYDVVNQKYIPFRAAIKGLSESGNATWEELSFIGRADKVYSYGGFNRSLTFTLTVVIGSIAELAPTWQRINYLTSLIKPANYTSATNSNGTNSAVGNIINRFMIPPMVMVTIGDLYTDQPVLIQSIVPSIPDDASWETQNETNMPDGWQYLANYMTSPGSLYGQLPRTIEIAISLILLEKERPIAGGANFGHAPRLDDYSDWNTETVPNGGDPTDIHKSFVVDISTKTIVPALMDAGKIQPSTTLPSLGMSITPQYGTIQNGFNTTGVPSSPPGFNPIQVPSVPPTPQPPAKPPLFFGK